MPLGQYTKCDLQYQKATLDFDAMMLTARIAVSREIESIEKYKNGLYEAAAKEDSTLVHLNAEWLMREAKLLLTASEVLSTLIGGKDRRYVNVRKNKKGAS